MNRIDRLTGTLLMLQSQRRLSAQSIASHWEISERTVYRDIAALSEAGVPIVFEPDLGYRLLGGYEVPPVMFSEEEALAIFLSGEIAEQVADVSLKKSLRSALTKIKSVLPPERKELLQDFKKSLGIWLHSQSMGIQTDCLIPIHNAVLQQKCMEVHYDTADRGQITQRIVEPQGILFYGNHWHLIAYCRYRQDYRDFRMDRMREWKVLEEDFFKHIDFSLEEFVEKRDFMEEYLTVTLVAKATVAKQFRSYLHFEPLEEMHFENGDIRFKIQTLPIQYCVNWFLGYGNRLTIEEPVELRDRLKEMAQSIVDQYS